MTFSSLKLVSLPVLALVSNPAVTKHNNDVISHIVAAGEADRSSASQDIPHFLRNQRVHYRIHKSSPHVPILIPIDPVHASTSHFSNIYFNIILPSTPGSSKWFSPSGFPTKPCRPVYLSSPLPICATCTAHLKLIDFITQ